MSELSQNTTPSLEVEEAAYLASMKELLKQIKIRFDNDPRQYTKRDYYYLIQYLCQNLNYLDSIGLTHDFKDIIERVSTNTLDIEQLKNSIDAIEHTIVSDANGDDFIIVEELNNGKNYAISAEVVRGTSENTGLATDGYVKSLVSDLSQSVVHSVNSVDETLQTSITGNEVNIELTWAQF